MLEACLTTGERPRFKLMNLGYPGIHLAYLKEQWIGEPKTNFVYCQPGHSAAAGVFTCSRGEIVESTPKS